MFGLFKKNSNECPVPEALRLWLEDGFMWLTQEFGLENIASKPMLLPTPQHFPFLFDGSKESLIKTAAIVANQMELDMSQINLELYNDSIQEFRGDGRNRMWTTIDKVDRGLTQGLFFPDKNENGQFDIFIEKANLTDPLGLVATLAHEFAHIKLLGEQRIEENDEYLTDLTTVIFGLGIFNANTCFRQWQSIDSFGHKSAGYLKQQEWGYALALYAFYRQEQKIDWVNHLTPNVRSDFRKSLLFMDANPELIFKEPEQKEE